MAERDIRGRFIKGITGNPTGRPKVYFFARPHQEQIQLALQNALITRRGSERGAAKIIAGITMGKILRRPEDYAPEGRVMARYQLETVMTCPENRRRVLRNELQRLKRDRDVALWLYWMGECLLLALWPCDPSDKIRMLDCAGKAGEREIRFAAEILGPIFDWTLSRSSPVFVPTQARKNVIFR